MMKRGRWEVKLSMLLLGIGFLLSPGAALASDTWAVVFYDDSNLAGNSYTVEYRHYANTLALGYYWDGTLSTLNNDINSLKIRPGYAVKLCSGLNLEGSCLTYTNPNSSIRTIDTLGSYHNNTTSSFSVRRGYYFKHDFPLEHDEALCSGNPTSLCFENCFNVNIDGRTYGKIFYNLLIPVGSKVEYYNCGDYWRDINNLDDCPVHTINSWAGSPYHDYYRFENLAKLLQFAIGFTEYTSGEFITSDNSLFPYYNATPTYSEKTANWYLFSGKGYGQAKGGAARVSMDERFFASVDLDDGVGNTIAHEATHTILRDDSVILAAKGLWEGFTEIVSEGYKAETDSTPPGYKALHGTGYHSTADRTKSSYIWDYPFTSQMHLPYASKWFWQHMGSMFYPDGITDWSIYDYSFYPGNDPSFYDWSIQETYSIFFWADVIRRHNNSATKSLERFAYKIEEAIDYGGFQGTSWDSAPYHDGYKVFTDWAAKLFKQNNLGEVGNADHKFLTPQFNYHKYSPTYTCPGLLGTQRSVSFNLGSEPTDFTIIVKAYLGKCNGDDDDLRMYVDTDTTSGRPLGKTWDHTYASGDQCYAFGDDTDCRYSDNDGHIFEGFEAVEEGNYIEDGEYLIPLKGIGNYMPIPITKFIPSTSIPAFQTAQSGSHTLYFQSDELPQLVSVDIVRGIVDRAEFHAHPGDLCGESSPYYCQKDTDGELKEMLHSSFGTGNRRIVVDTEAVTWSTKDYGLGYDHEAEAYSTGAHVYNGKHDGITPVLHNLSTGTNTIAMPVSVGAYWNFANLAAISGGSASITRSDPRWLNMSSRVEFNTGTTAEKDLRYRAHNRPFLSAVTAWERSGVDVSKTIYTQVYPYQSAYMRLDTDNEYDSVRINAESMDDVDMDVGMKMYCYKYGNPPFYEMTVDPVHFDLAIGSYYDWQTFNIDGCLDVFLVFGVGYTNQTYDNDPTEGAVLRLEAQLME